MYIIIEYVVYERLVIKMSNNTRVLVAINTIGRIIEIFLGPFLTAYIFKVSTDSIISVSLYNIFSYIIITLFSFVVGILIKNKYKMLTLRIGMISKFIQLIILTLLGKKVIKFIWLVAIIEGFSTITWYFPINLFSSVLVPNKEKKDYVVYKNIIINITMVILPALFGAIISEKSFEKTTIIVLVLSFVQIILSFKLDYKENNNSSIRRFKLLDTINTIKKDNNIKEFFKMTFFVGMTSAGALKTTISLLIIIAFSKDFSFGIVTSITYLSSIISAYICKKIICPKKIKVLIYMSGIVPLFCTIVLLFITNQYTIIIYNILYAFFIQIINIVRGIKTLKITNSSIINDSNRVEVYVLIEFMLGMGRIISFILLLIVGFFNSFYMLKILIIFLTICIFLSGLHLSKIEIE